MRRGFTLLEMLVASGISIFILAGLCVAMTSVWREAVKTNEELQVLLKAASLRERLLLGDPSGTANGFEGLLNLTNKLEAVNSGRYLRVKGATKSYASEFTFGKSKKGSKSSVSVTDLTTEGTNSLGYVEERQRVQVYLWVTTPAGTACRMPVSVTTARAVEDEPEEE